MLRDLDESLEERIKREQDRARQGHVQRERARRERQRAELEHAARTAPLGSLGDDPVVHRELGTSVQEDKSPHPIRKAEERVAAPLGGSMIGMIGKALLNGIVLLYGVGFLVLILGVLSLAFH